MATFVASAVHATTPALPAGTAINDWVIVFAYRDQNATPPTLPAGWTDIIIRSAGNGLRICYKWRDSAWTMPSFVNATRTVAVTVRPASGKVLKVGVNAVQGATSTSVAWAVQTLQVTDGTSVILRGFAHTRPDATPGTPANHTLIDATGTRPGFGTYRKTTTTDMAAATLTVSRSDVWSSGQVEIRDAIAPLYGTATVAHSWAGSASGTAPIAPAVTQAGYRFYDQGSESGSTPLGAENTPITGVLTTGDGIGSLRVLLQSTTTRALPATDDWQLQFEKNASGTWIEATEVPHLYDSEQTISSTLNASQPSIWGFGQSFIGNGERLISVSFALAKTGAPTFGLKARLYAHTGTYGSTSLPTGPILTESNTILASTFKTGSPGAFVSFIFNTPVVLTNGVPYVVALAVDAPVDASNFIHVGVGPNAASHAGNASQLNNNTTWSVTTNDLNFQLFTLLSPAVIPYFDPALIEGAPTTNRLTGSGTFSPGKVSLFYGWVQDVGIPGNGFTELLYSVQIKRTEFAQGDTIRFRVITNSIAPLTYSQTPLVNIINAFVSPKTGTAEVSHSWSISATGTAPVVPVKQGSATVSWIETITASGTKPVVAPKTGSATTSWSADVTASGTAPAITGTTVTDDFNRENSIDLGPNWTTSGGTSAQILNNKAVGGNASINYWNAGTFANDQYSEADFTISNTEAGPMVRVGSPNSGYLLDWHAGSGGTLQFFKRSSTTSFNSLGIAATGVGTSGTKRLRLEISGSTLSAYDGGFFIASITDSEYTTGAPGIWGDGGASATDNFLAGYLVGGVPPNTGIAPATWSEAISAQGKKSPIATSTTSWTETITATGKRTPKATATASYLETIIATGTKAPKATATATWTEALTAQGKKSPRATAATSYLETISVTSKRNPIATSTANHSWTSIAQGVKPVVGVKQGSAIATWSEALSSVGKRTPKAAVTTQYVETVTAVGSKLQRGTSTTSWLETIAAAGKRNAIATGTTAYLETISAIGKKTPKAVSTANHSWTSIAQGFKPVVGQKQGSAIAVWSETITATGKRAPIATSTTLYSENVTAAGKKIQKSTGTTTWTNAITAQGKKLQKATSTIAYLFTGSAVGKKIPKAVTTANHSWVSIAQGFKPVVGQKQGTAIVSWAETSTAVGKRFPKATATVSYFETVTVNGKKFLRGTATVAWTETISAIGKKVLRGSSTVLWSESVTVSGKRIPKAFGAVFHSWDLLVDGKYYPKAMSTVEILWQLSATGVDERGIVILNDADSIFLGNLEVKAVYVGSNKVWEML